MTTEARLNHILKTENVDKDELFPLLYQLYHPMLLKVVSQYVNSKEDAQEVLQDAFIKIWHKRNMLDLNDNLSGYLYSITRNTCLDFLRTKKDKLSVESNYDQQKNLLNYYALSNNAASSIIEKELHEKLMQSIDTLPEKCRLIFIKSRYEGLNHKQISKELQISTKTIENQITKALKHLRISLKEFLH